MKRHKDLYQKIIDINNLKLADKNARKGKLKQTEVVRHIENEEQNLIELHRELSNNRFNTSEYRVFKINEGKEREIKSLPYYPDRIVQHAILNIIEPIFVNCFTKDTYSCIKGRGVHKASYDLREALSVEKPRYCLKLDIEKFYPSIDNDILKIMLRKKFKDAELLNLLDNIIDSTTGVPIGSYLSQFFANFYLTYFDHWIKENLKVKHYFRYSDDIIILGYCKNELHLILNKISGYLSENLNLTVKSNYQVFPIEKRGIDWVGYVHYHTHTLIRKKIKLNFIRSKNRKNHYGWLKHANTKNLLNKYKNESKH